MKRRVFWLISLCAILLALFFHLGGLGAAQKRVQLVNELNKAMIAQDVEKQQSLKAEGKQLGKLCDERIISGWISGIISLSCLFISYRRNEPSPRSIVIVLMLLYLLLQLAVV